MTIERKVGMGIAGQPTGPAADVAEVFSTYLYTGTGSAQTITNGIDLAGEGGLVWSKNRGLAEDHCLTDTVRGAGNYLLSSADNAQQTDGNIASFNSSGYVFTGNGRGNYNNYNYASWTFRKKEKFFDIVTWTGNGSNRWVSHSLGSVPAMIIVKRTDSANSWFVYHTSGGNAGYYTLDITDPFEPNVNFWNSTTPTDTQFRLGTEAQVNSNGGSYVAYLFADNSTEDAKDQIIKCGSYTGNGSATGPTVTLGWEPQFILVKRSDDNDNWVIFDSMRGIVSGGNDSYLKPNSSVIEVSANGLELTPTGFKLVSGDGQWNANNATYIYMAIRAPMMKEPEAATDVFAVSTGNTSATLISAGFPSDFIISKGHGSGETPVASTRLTNGDGKRYLRTDSNSAELVGGGGKIFEFDLGDNFRQSWGNDPSTTYMFKRAKGFFDVVTFANNSTNAVSHNLGVAPEMAIVKTRGIAGGWLVDFVSANVYGSLDVVFPFDPGNAFDPYYSTTFAGSGGTAGITKIAYLFATLAGISKVGNYTGNGSSQTINCGFSAGARFILIKQSNGYPDWYVWDSARGIVAGNDPHWSPNSTAAQVTNDDSIDPANSGFTVNQISATGINASGGNYVFLAIA